MQYATVCNRVQQYATVCSRMQQLAAVSAPPRLAPSPFRWICLLTDADQRNGERRPGTLPLLPGVSATVDGWSEDGTRSLGQHRAGAYQGYASPHDKPEELYGAAGVATLRRLQAGIDGAAELFGRGAGLEPLAPPPPPVDGLTEYVLVTGGIGGIGFAVAEALSAALPRPPSLPPSLPPFLPPFLPPSLRNVYGNTSRRSQTLLCMTQTR